MEYTGWPTFSFIVSGRGRVKVSLKIWGESYLQDFHRSKAATWKRHTKIMEYTVAAKGLIPNIEGVELK